MFIKLKQKLSGLFSTQGTLSQKAARSGVWVLTSFGFSKLCYFTRTIILVRLLAPEDFGLMGIALLAAAVMAVFSETGIGAALIQRKKYDKDTLNTAWIISVIRGFVLFAALFFTSPLFAKFYENPEIEPILKVIAFSFLFSGISNIGIILFQKELDFKKKVIYDQITNLSNIIFTIIFAFAFRNVWALVLGHIIGTFVGAIGSYFIHPFRPSFKFKPDVAKELFQFGKHIFASGVIIFLVTQGDNALVGKVLGLSALGFYVLAYNLSNLPTTAITHVISQVSFPAYSKLQDDIPRLREAYKKVLRFTSILSIPLAAGLFILAPELIGIVYGEKWLPMVPAMQVLCLFGVVRSFGATTGPVFLGKGNPEIIVKLTLLQLIIMAVTIYPLTRLYGIFGAAISVTTASFIANIFSLTEIAKITKEKINTYLSILKIALIPSILMALLIFIIKKYLIVEVSLFLLCFLIIFGVLVYFLYIFLLNKDILNELKTVVKSV